MRIALARAISIAGHPVVLVSVAGLIAASTQGAPIVELQTIGVALALLTAAVLGFMLFQVRTGRWAHVDASNRSERPSLNIFLVGLLLACALLVWYFTHDAHMPVALSLAAAMIGMALLLSRWVKASLHTAFAVFATALLWPLKVAVLVGIIVTAAIAWSRLALRRHVVADVVVGLALGLIAGGAYAVWNA